MFDRPLLLLEAQKIVVIGGYVNEFNEILTKAINSRIRKKPTDPVKLAESDVGKLSPREYLISLPFPLPFAVVLTSFDCVSTLFEVPSANIIELEPHEPFDLDRGAIDSDFGHRFEPCPDMFLVEAYVDADEIKLVSACDGFEAREEGDTVNHKAARALQHFVFQSSSELGTEFALVYDDAQGS